MLIVFNFRPSDFRCARLQQLDSPKSHTAVCSSGNRSANPHPCCHTTNQVGFCRRSTAARVKFRLRFSLIYLKCSLGFSSQIYVWVNGKGKVKRFNVSFAARRAKLRRFFVCLAVKRLFAAVRRRYENYCLQFRFAVAKFRIFSDYLVLQFLQSVFDVHFPASPVVLKYRSSPFL